jgi:hypothetical protein
VLSIKMYAEVSCAISYLEGVAGYWLLRLVALVELSFYSSSCCNVYKLLCMKQFELTTAVCCVKQGFSVVVKALLTRKLQGRLHSLFDT